MLFCILDANLKLYHHASHTCQFLCLATSTAKEQKTQVYLSLLDALHISVASLHNAHGIGIIWNLAS